MADADARHQAAIAERASAEQTRMALANQHLHQAATEAAHNADLLRTTSDKLRVAEGEAAKWHAVAAKNQQIACHLGAQVSPAPGIAGSSSAPPSNDVQSTPTFAVSQGNSPESFKPFQDESRGQIPAASAAESGIQALGL